MRKYDSGEGLSGIELKGGVTELSREIGRLAEEDPERFLALGVTLEDDIRPAYFDAIIEGGSKAVSETGEHADTLWHLIGRVHQLPEGPCGRQIAWAIERLATLDVPSEALQTLAHHATQDSDPAGDGAETSILDDGTPNWELLGLNSNRGAAFLAIARLLFTDRARATLLRDTVLQGTKDPSPAVLTCVVEVLTAWLNVDVDEAVAWFVSVADREPGILRARTVDTFIHYAAVRRYNALRPLLLRMLEQDETSQLSAATQICVAAMSEPEAEAEAGLVRRGSPVQRRGAAVVYAANLSATGVADACRRYLTKFFVDPDEDVRKAASDWLRQLSPDELLRETELVLSFIESPAFAGNLHFLVRKLDQAEGRLPDIALMIAERAVDAIGAEGGDISTAAAGEASNVSNVVFRLYEQTQSDDVRRRCLDLIDRMIRLSFYGVLTRLDEAP